MSQRLEMNDLVSIIIPCYKQAQYLPDALDSVLAQTYLHWECVVVNDASPDNTLAVAKRYADKDSRIRVLNLEKNGGLANARNSGIAATTGSLILPLDADDKIAPDCIEKSVAVMLSNPIIKVVYSDVIHFGGQHHYQARPDINIKELCHQNLFQPTALFKRSDYLLTQGYRNNIYGYEDWDMWLQLIDEPQNGYRIKEGLFYPRVKEHSMIIELKKDIDKERKVRMQLYAYNRHKIQKHYPELAFSNERMQKQQDWKFLLHYRLMRLLIRAKMRPAL